MEWENDPGWQYLRQSMDQILKDQSKPFNAKTACWVPDKEEGFLLAEIKSQKGDSTVIFVKGAEQTVKTDILQEVNPPKFTKCEDISHMSFLNEASVLCCLRERYESMLIYTYSGLFCVVVNPYKRLPIYTDSVARIYMGKRKNEVPPHLFAASDEAFRNMMQDNQCQSMLITGESGAGKTENTKKVISYFASLGAAQAEAAGLKTEAKGPTLEEKIVQTNPVLEAFGNAKTVRNNNSSRFGKFIRIHFSKDGRVAGCDIEHYLLEKSRVIRQAPGERAYHMFYQLMSGFQPDLKGKLELDKEPKDYWYVNQAETTIPGVDDKEEFEMTDEAFDILNFSKEEKFDVYRLCSAIVHMGEMQFKQRGEQAEPDGKDEAGKAAEMFGVNVDHLLTAFCKPRVKVGTEWVNKGQTKDQVCWSVGAMSKGIYDRLFDWLVMKCNLTLDAKELQRAFFVGVLDIAGFEIFDFNSFEQLWINFVNEKLQQFFNHHMFVLEQEEYQREGIQWTFIDFGLDLAAGIELLEKPMGIISALDEECVVPKGSDATYAQKLNEAYLGKHPKFEKPKPPKGKQSEAHFALVQYAGTVRYNVSNWLEKNKDPLNDTVAATMKKSTGNDLIVTLWQSYQTQEEAAEAQKAGGGGGGKKKGKSASMMTVSMKYRESLNNLMSMLHTTHPHFIRCLIPNELKKSGLLAAELVMHQLTCNGVLEGIRICRKGFPNRMMHADFKQRYAILAADPAKGDASKKTSDAMMAKVVSDKVLDADDFRVGETKVFFKAGILAKMEDARDEKLSNLLKMLQGIIRWYTALTDIPKRKERIENLMCIKSNIKSWTEVRTWDWFKLLGRVKGMFEMMREQEKMANLGKYLQESEEKLAKENALLEETQTTNENLIAETEELKKQNEQFAAGYKEADERMNKYNDEKEELEKKIATAESTISMLDSECSSAGSAKKRMEAEAEKYKQQLQDLEMTQRKGDSDTKAKEHQARSLQDELQAQDDSLAKLRKECKHQEDIGRKLAEDLQAAEDKVNHLNKVKTKVESSLEEMEDVLERERRGGQDTSKSKRKLEGELKVAHETFDELTRQKADVENSLKKKDSEINNVSSRLEDETSAVAKLQRQIKEIQNRIAECEEELESERVARGKADRAKSDLQREIEEMHERLDEAGGVTSAQHEINKRREAELSKLRRELDECSMSHENQLGGLRKKHNDSVAEMADQLDQLQKQKAKIEKDKSGMAREIEDMHATVDQESKARANLDKIVKQLELQVSDLEGKCEDQGRQLQDFGSHRNRLQNESTDLSRQLEENESQVALLQRLKSQMTAQLEEVKRTADEEARERQSLSAQSKNLQHECDQIRDRVDEENEAKNEVLRHLSKANAEIQEWRAKFENEGLLRGEELEDAKRKLAQKLSEVQDSLDAVNGKIVNLEKQRARQLGELDDAHVEIERVVSLASSLEKKQKGFDKTCDEWRHKHDDLSAELDASQREARSVGTEVYKLKNHNDELLEQMEGLRRENKNLAQEIKDLADQLSEGGRTVHEMQKMVRRLEVEKEELHQALDEAEAALETEEAKVIRTQAEVAQVRQEIEKRIAEKEEEFESTRKNHQRALESMQASLESESRGRAELQRVKKKLEGDINELEIALDHANKANSDAQKNLRKCQDQIKETQMAVEEEQRHKDDMKEQFNTCERRLAVLVSECDDMRTQADTADRARKQAEFEAHEARDQSNELSSHNANLQAQKRKAESELGAMHSDLDDTLNELKNADENAKKAMADAARLAEELRQEQEHSMHQERMRKGLEQQIKDMQVRLDEAEAAALKGGKKVIAKLEQRMRELEVELDGEQRRHSETSKGVAREERRVRELQFQIDESKKNGDRLTDLVDKLQQKLKISKRQVEEAEEVATANLQKYRQLQHQLEDAEERAEQAENGLSKLRARGRSTASMVPLGSSPSAVFRSGSRADF